MSDAIGPQRVTLDGQLVAYWEREAARFDELQERAAIKWMARSYARRAERARALAETSRRREAARGRDPGSS
ncbi:hypothetical protein [Methylobacterium haplocladii]|uniref:Uncharacterized protein n=1 Tax=Methylobacterium haplocladii TaxID=1176176 RepID=A0A512IRA4_9HYPH|nr:hypothetical protein [Methylobacterium haplocladii]GEP00238.1 hypothetical protein MHA02_26250 [Methylobacterium haplocladii]GJD84254.1 hypothetical protein HPGCJGGD_2129 [Methylobacterium haplocladii]GLS60869.1 hypothetical protein GCM10007887_35580 [Methylobacterium haplocladii]